MVELKKHLEIVLFHVRFWLKEYGMTLENCLQSNITKLQLLGWSLLKYSIFIGQYLWVAYLLQIQLPIVTIFLCLAILFLLLSILPTISITELVVRGQLFIMILAPFYSNKASVVSLSSIIWGVNFLIPAIMGTILLLGYRIKK
jgi:succinate-acetate transporter protein